MITFFLDPSGVPDPKTFCKNYNSQRESTSVDGQSSNLTSTQLSTDQQQPGYY